MVTGFEGTGLKAVIDALVALFGKAQKKRLTAEGKKALEEAMKELLMAPNDIHSAEAKVRIAKAAGIISDDVALAEDWIQKHKAAKVKSAVKKAPAKKAAAKKKVARKKAPKKKAAKKKVARKK
jgi:hypothetical protein